MKILAIGAHFDDVEVGCGGTLLDHKKKKHKIFIAITHSSEFRTGDPGIRLEEQRRACDILDCRHHLKLFTPRDDMATIISELDKIKANIIYAPYYSDTHQDHVYASRIGLAVGRRKNIDVLLYDSGSAYDFNPVLFNTINSIDKCSLMKCFSSQLKRKVINLAEVKQRDLRWGYLILKDNHHAEGFVVHKMRYKI